MRHAIAALLLIALAAAPASAKLSSKEQARVDRAAPEDQEAVAHCLEQRKKGKKTGALVGTAAGAAGGLIGGGNLGETALAAGAGALAGGLLGRGSGTNKTCDEVLKANK